MGWIKDPKKGYNKVYNKTTFGVNDVVKTVSELLLTKTRMALVKIQKKHINSAAKTSIHQEKAVTKQKLDYNILVNAKPALSESVIIGIIGIIIFLFSKIIGAIILAIALYLFCDYKHRTSTNDYISDKDLANWISILKKYYDPTAQIDDYSQALDYTKNLLASQYKDLKKYYDMISEKKRTCAKR